MAVTAVIVSEPAAISLQQHTVCSACIHALEVTESLGQQDMSHARDSRLELPSSGNKNVTCCFSGFEDH